MRTDRIVTAIVLFALIMGSVLILKPGESLPTRDSAPFLSGASVSPTTGTKETNFTFSINYGDFDNDIPNNVTLTVDNTTYHMSQFNSSVTNYTRGVKFTYSTKMSVGTHYYHFDADNAYASVRDPKNGSYNLKVSKNTSGTGPQLSNPVYSPSRPTAKTGVTFNVTYIDSNGSAPSSVKLMLKNSTVNQSYSMSVGSGNYTKGVICTIFKQLSAGNYSYAFKATGSGNKTVFLPKTGYYALYVAPGGSSGSPPQLKNPTVAPSSPVSGDTVYFNVTYVDPDNDAPSSIKVELKRGGTTNLINMSINGTAYTRGVLCSAVTRLVQGNYSYRFLGVNVKNESVTLPSTGYYGLFVSGKANLPKLYNATVSPKSPVSGENVYFNVTYKDADDDAPRIIQLNLIEGRILHTVNMSVSGTSYDTGVSCSASKQLSSGNYSYRFYVKNSLGEWVYDPSNGYYTLHVAVKNKTNNPPILSNNSVNPSSPTDQDMIYFNVTYRDPDNDPPKRIYVYSRDFKLNMTTLESYSYDTGLTYTAKTKLSAGTYNYRYIAESANSTVGLPDTQLTLVVTNSTSRIPTMSDARVLPSDPAADQNVNFSVKYKDPLGGKHNPSVRLYIKHEGEDEVYFNMTKTGDNFTSGVIYHKTLKLLSGNYSYRFRYWVYNGSFVYPSGYNLTLYVKPNISDRSPNLSNGTHSIGSGGNVTFTVEYKDADGDSPSYVYLKLAVLANGTYGVFKSHSMSWSGSKYTRGVTASYLKTLTPGSYRYYYTTFSLGSYGNGSARYPLRSYITLNISSVKPKNSAPALYSPSVSPSRPKGGQNVNFSVDYKDSDGDAPSFVKLHISVKGANYSSYSMKTSGKTYLSGVNSFKSLILSAGNYSYFFTASDGNKTVRTPSSGIYSLIVSKNDSGGGGSDMIDTSAKLIGDQDGLEMEMTKTADGLTLEFEGYEDGVIHLKITSEDVKDRVIDLEMDSDLLGEETEKGIVVKIDGEVLTFADLDSVLSREGDSPSYHVEKVNGKYRLHVFIPDASTHNMETSMGEVEDGGKSPALMTVLIVLGVIAIVSAAGIALLTTAQLRKKREAFYRDFDLDVEEESVVSGKLEGDKKDWDEMLE